MLLALAAASRALWTRLENFTEPMLFRDPRHNWQYHPWDILMFRAWLERRARR
jgi:hypothetical protein